MMQTPFLISKEMLSSKCPARPEFGHKGTFGRALICAGSQGMGGAAYMAAASALRSGAGLVYILTEEELLSPLLTMCPEALGLFFPGKMYGSGAELAASPKAKGPLLANGQRVMGTSPFAQWFAEQLTGKEACLIGPGIPPSSKKLNMMIRIAAEHAPHLILDAGALTCLAQDPEALSIVSKRTSHGLAPAVLTPHIGEFLRFAPVPKGKKGAEMRVASAFAEENKVVLVLKSHETNIFTPDGKWYSNPVENSGLAKGGSGDVLAGLLTGLLSQGMTEEDASLCAVGIHSLAGRMCAEEHGKRAMLLTMLWNYYDKCFMELKWEEGTEK